MNSKSLMGIVGALVLAACSDKATESQYIGTSTFPLTAGSRWVYEQNHHNFRFSDSSYTETEINSIIRHVAGPDTVIDGIQMIAVDDSTVRADSIDQNPYVARHLYSIVENQLREYGRITIFPWGDEVPVYFNPPHIILDLPITSGKNWTSHTESLGDVRCNVAGIEYINVADTAIKCDVIRKRLIDGDTGHLYYDSFHWFSNDGLMRDEFDYGTDYIDDGSGNIIDSIRATEVLELLEFEIVP